jgi:hypothetical protein
VKLTTENRAEIVHLIERRSIGEPNTGCWIWDGAWDADGYGRAKFDGEGLPAHRLAWMGFRGRIPVGLTVRHRCDVSCCVNPDHLSLGTIQDNIDDRTASGRFGGRGHKSRRVTRWAREAKREPSVAAPLTQDRLRALLDYDPLTGIFRWRYRPEAAPEWNTRFVGLVAGAASDGDYRRIRIENRAYLGHRLAWFYVHGTLPENDIDHVNFDRVDNRIANLRLSTRTENNRHSRIRITNTSGHKGVSWDVKRGLWFAKITVNRKQIALGRFAKLDDAVAAYRAAELKHFGDFATEGIC